MSKDMKKWNLLFLVGIGLGMTGMELQAEDKPAEVVELEYVKVAGFTDFEYSGMGEAKTGRIFAKRVHRYFANHESLIPKGFRLKLTITDIDLAGEVEPWRNSNGDDIRYVRPNYYPRMSFSWTLYDGEGGEVASGEERLKDMDFDLRPGAFRTSELFYDELEMLGDWAKKVIKPLGKEE